jgi:hypothetical protein
MKHTLAPTVAAILCLLGAPALALTCENGNLPGNPTALYAAGGGTVTDTRTGLVWAQCLEGQGDADCSGGAVAAMTWDEALGAAAQATLGGHTDWRLPNVKELRSLLEYCRTAPAINGDVFPNQPSAGVWTGTPAGDDHAWWVDFEDGLPGRDERATGAHAVRLVRGGGQGAALALLPRLSGTALDTVTHERAAVRTVSSQDGTVHALVLARGAAAPTPAQVKAGAATSASAQGGAVVELSVAGLADGTDYDLYLVAESAQGLLGSAAVRQPFTTVALGACGPAASGGLPWLIPPGASDGLCQAGTASTPAEGSPGRWSWSCQGLSGPPAQCQAPRGYEVMGTGPVAGGAVACATGTVVAHGGTLACTATPAPGHRLAQWTDDCSGSDRSAECRVTLVDGPRRVGARFVPGADLTLAEGPRQGQPLLLDLAPGGGWQLAAVATHTVAFVGEPPPPGVTLPHGVVSVALHQGTQGSSAEVVLTYPMPLPPGTVYYKYGPTRDEPQPHWYPFGGARIAGNTITLTLTDGEDGDGDLARNGSITDPGGPALLAGHGGAQAIPTLGEWGLLLLSALLGALGLRRFQAK